MDYGVTNEGFVLKRFDTILSELQTAVSSELGFDVSLDPQSVINAAILMPMADKLAELWEVAQSEYYAKFPATATGINLDNACSFGSVRRQQNRKSKYKIRCQGTDGTTTIPAGSLIASDTSPSIQLSSVSAFSLSRSACNSIVIKVAAVAAGNYTITANNAAYTFTATGSSSESDILTGLYNAFTDSSFSKSLDTGAKTITISSVNAESVNVFVLTNNLTTESVFCLVDFETVDYGDILVPNGRINKIISNIVGLRSVTNNLPYIAGRLEETDSELRRSYIEKAYSTASNMAKSLRSYLLEHVDGVKSVSIFENATDATVSSRPPHSFETVVYGGGDNLIADAILEQKPAGIATYGSTTVQKITEWGDTINIKFSRPTEVYIWIKLTITASGGSSSYNDSIKEKVMELAKDNFIGDDVLYQKFIKAAYDIVPGATVCVSELASTASPTGTPSYSANNITIGDAEIPMFDKSRVEVAWGQ